MNADRFRDTMGAFDDELNEYKQEEERRLIGFLSKKYKIPILKFSSIDPSALRLISMEDAMEAKMVIYKRLKGKLSIAMYEPNNEKLKEVLRSLENRGFSYKLEFTTTQQLRHMWSYYQDMIATSATIPGRISITNEDLEMLVKRISTLTDVQDLLKKIKNLPPARKTSKNIEYILFSAISLGASDIHLEATQSGGNVRYRLHGVLTLVYELDKVDFKKVITRLKLTSRMKISIKGAQDGGFVVVLPDRTISIRASVIPGDKGDSFVLRILDPNNVIHDIEKLGLHSVVMDIFKRNVIKTNGLILTTGPTGSGKTTTLYSFLNMVKQEDTKIITIEDPVEYRLKGITQTQIKKGYSFANALRSILRQDPDVILVGEIRDEEVATITIQASLTGHLVFSTLHTNDAVGALHRLNQLDVDSSLFSRSINMVIAQRLVRTLCSRCSEKHTLSDNEKTEIERRIKLLPNGYIDESISIENIRRPSEKSKDCLCNDGYDGRVGIFEVFEMTSEVEKAFTAKKTIDEIILIIKKQGVPFLEDDCIWKVLRGQTSLYEMKRVLGIQI